MRRAIEDIGIDGIIIPSRARPLNEATVIELMQSIDKIGLRTPITVRCASDVDVPDIYLVSGHHRLEACKRLGHETIDAFVAEDATEDEARLWEIAENLHRAELTALERSEHIAEWIRLAEIVLRQPDAKPGRPESGVRKAARHIGLSEPDARRAVHVDSLTPEAKEAARAVGLDDNRSALLQAAREAPERQETAIREIAERKAAQVESDVKDRAAKEAAEIIAEHVPGEWWDALKANLYAAGARNVANALTNITGESIMDRRYGN